MKPGSTIRAPAAMISVPAGGVAGRVGKAGEPGSAAGVENFGAGGERALDLAARAGGHDAPVAHVQRAVGDDAEFPHGWPRARTGRPGEGDELAAVEDGEISHKDRKS